MPDQNISITQLTERAKVKQVKLTPPGKSEIDWQRVVDLKPQGYVEINDRRTILKGPIKSISISPQDNVVISLLWVASTSARHPITAQTCWQNAPARKTHRFQNFEIPFTIREIANKGPVVESAYGIIIYINKNSDFDPRLVKGLTLREYAQAGHETEDQSVHTENRQNRRIVG